MSGTDLPKVLIAAPVRDREYHLPTYLKSLQALDYPKEKLGFYFLVNDSTDGSRKILGDFLNNSGGDYFRIEIEEVTLGTVPDKRKMDTRKEVYHALARLRNTVLDKFSQTACDYLFSVDSDIFVNPNCLGRLLSHRKDFVAAMISNLPVGMVPNAMVRRNGSLLRFKPPEGDPTIHEVTVTGAVCLMSREVLVGRYAWSKQGEDLPFCESLIEKGIKIYLDTAQVAVHDMRKH
ncbi:MAG: hypothetical protein Q8P59_00260 [Dehalococcoidia bacterium]|nr:hypothetical protein [Dehalococcoidia bacterium]